MATETEMLYGTRMVRMIPFGDGETIKSEFVFYQRGPEIDLPTVSDISRQINPGWNPLKSWVATREEVIKYGELPLLPNPNKTPPPNDKFRGW